MLLSKDSLLSLDADVLLLILKHAQSRKCLLALSCTCRWIRELATPILFARIRLLPRHFTPQTFVPSNLWPHVRTLKFDHKCEFDDPDVVEEYNRRIRRTRRTNSKPHRRFLFDAVRGMSQLRNLVVDTLPGAGLPFWILNALLSAPQLSSIHFGPTMCLPSDKDPTLPGSVKLTGPIAPIVSFRRVLPSFARNSKAAAEADTLSCLFEQIHESLQVAEMPIETAPLRTFQTNDWPCLRKLVLRGEPQPSASASSFADVLARMPNLRILKLELAQLAGTGPIRVLPSGWKSAFPCPDLTELTVSFPDPDDDLYTCLPEGLRKLTLRCFPRRYVALAPKTHGRFMPERGWTSSLLPSSEMLRLLRRCGSSLGELRHLDIEFEESEDDILLLRCIASVSPMLTSLQILRYHKEPSGDASFLADFGVALAPLAHLRLLRLHLDLTLSDDKGPAPDVLGPLVHPLSATLRFVCILKKKYCESEWSPFRVLRNSQTGRVTILKCAAYSFMHIDGFGMSDETYLPPPRRRGAMPKQKYRRLY